MGLEKQLDLLNVSTKVYIHTSGLSVFCWVDSAGCWSVHTQQTFSP